MLRPHVPLSGSLQVEHDNESCIFTVHQYLRCYLLKKNFRMKLNGSIKGSPGQILSVYVWKLPHAVIPPGFAARWCRNRTD